MASSSTQPLFLAPTSSSDDSYESEDFHGSEAPGFTLDEIEGLNTDFRAATSGLRALLARFMATTDPTARHNAIVAAAGNLVSKDFVYDWTDLLILPMS